MTFLAHRQEYDQKSAQGDSARGKKKKKGRKSTSKRARSLCHPLHLRPAPKKGENRSPREHPAASTSKASSRACTRNQRGKKGSCEQKKHFRAVDSLAGSKKNRMKAEDGSQRLGNLLEEKDSPPQEQPSPSKEGLRLVIPEGIL